MRTNLNLGSSGGNNNNFPNGNYPPGQGPAQPAPAVNGTHQNEYLAGNYYPQGQYPNYHQNYYVTPQPALTATSGSQITYQLQDPPQEALGEIKYTIDETDRRRGGKKSKKNRPDGETAENEVERVFIWDLDETIIIFHSLLTSSYAQRYGKVMVITLTLLDFLFARSVPRNCVAERLFRFASEVKTTLGKYIYLLV